MKKKEIIKISKKWLKKAKEDLITAETLLDSPEERLEFLTASIGFHSQQCVEKCLKAILTFKGLSVCNLPIINKRGRFNELSNCRERGF